MKLKLLFVVLVFALTLSAQADSARELKPETATTHVDQNIASNISEQLTSQNYLSTKQKASIGSLPASKRIFKKALHNENGTVSYVRGQLSSGPIGGSLRDVVDQGWHQLRNIKALNLNTETGSFIFQKLKEDKLRKTHAWYQQAKDGIPIWGKQVVFHLDEKNQVYQLQGDYLSKTSVNIKEPGISLEQALEYARIAVEAENIDIRSAELNYFQTEDSELRLSYKFDLTEGIDKRWTILIDAWNGSVLHIIHNIHYAGEIREASGKNLSGETVNFNSWFENEEYHLIDPTIPTIDENYAPLSRGPNASGDTFIYDMQETNGTISKLVKSFNRYSGWDPTAVTALQNTHHVYNYYLDTFSRKGIDDNNLNLIAAVHYRKDYANAFWNGSTMVYGNGDGKEFTPLVNCLDIAAHEMTHGVIEYTANFLYQNQSGALSESFADVFSVFVDRSNWTVGEDCTIVSPGYLRSLSNPESGLDPQPRKMSDYKNLPNTRESDNGGVHVNSGIPNHAAFLFVNRLIDLGFSKNEAYTRAEQIYYRALDVYLYASARFIDARRALISAAEDLYSSVEVNALNAVWDEVEVYDFGQSLVEQVPTSVREVPGDDVMLYVTPISGSLDLYAHIYEDASAIDVNNYIGPLNSRGFGIPVSLAKTRPAVVTNENGTLYFFIGSDFNLYSSKPLSSITGLGYKIEQLTTNGNIWSIAISPDGRYFAYTTRSRSPVINVIDFNAVDNSGLTVIEDSFSIEPASYIEGGDDVPETLLYADSLNFDFTGNKIVFDALNCVSLPDSACDNGGGYKYWSIGMLDILSRRVSNPMPSQNPTINLSFPTFATNNNYIIAMDRAEYDDSVAPPVYYSTVVSFNYETQEQQRLFDHGSANAPFLSVPSFWGNDRYLTTLVRSGNNTLAQKIELTDSWARADAEPEILSTQTINTSIMHRAAYRKLTSLLTLSSSVLQFGNLAIGAPKTLELTLSNKGDFDIELINISIADKEFTHDAINSRIPVNASKIIKVSFNGDKADSYKSFINIQTDGRGGLYNIPLFAKIVVNSGDADQQATTGAALIGGVGWMIWMVLSVSVFAIFRRRSVVQHSL